LDTRRAQVGAETKWAYYLSAEYLLGRQLDNNLLAADLNMIARQALAGLGFSLDVLRQVEIEPGLGNGGLGRLAACLLDSAATLPLAARPHRAGRPLLLPGSRLPQRHYQQLTPLERPGHASLQSPDLQPGRFYERGARQGGLGNPLQGALPGGRNAPGPPAPP